MAHLINFQINFVNEMLMGLICQFICQPNNPYKQDIETHEETQSTQQ